MQQAVMIKHADFFTTYSNVTNVSVIKGQKVTRNQVIAKSAKHNESKSYLCNSHSQFPNDRLSHLGSFIVNLKSL